MKLFCYFLTLLFVFFEVGLWDRRVCRVYSTSTPKIEYTYDSFSCEH